MRSLYFLTSLAPVIAYLLFAVSIPQQNIQQSSIFWDITRCSPLKIKRRVWGKCHPHLQARGKLAICFHALSRPILRLWRWRRHVPPKHPLTLNGLQNVIFWKMEVFITTAVGIWDPTCWALLIYMRNWNEKYRVENVLIFKCSKGVLCSKCWGNAVFRCFWFGII
jgi:hypothetical protein